MDQSLPDQPQTPPENISVESVNRISETRENLQNYEVPKAPVAEAVKSEAVDTIAAVEPTPAPTPNIVDMRGAKGKTHLMATPGVQKLTTIADQDEENFIGEVKAEHSNT